MSTYSTVGRIFLSISKKRCEKLYARSLKTVADGRPQSYRPSPVIAVSTPPARPDTTRSAEGSFSLTSARKTKTGYEKERGF